MKTARIEDVNSRAGPATEKRPLTEALDASALSLNHFELEPGDSFAFGYHAHENQEEIFYVLSGTATFETESDEVEVGPAEAVRFAPGEYQRGWNRNDERVVALAIGAPRDAGGQDVLWDCSDCGARTPNRIERTEGAPVTICEECGAETQRFDR